MKLEGLAREVIRFVQEARKSAELSLNDKIALFLGSESAVMNQAIAVHREFIASECQIARWLETAPADGYSTVAKVDGVALTISLRNIG